ncbi:metal ABC transporter permease [Falsiroseomonas selenitidurans]|uniref:Metal ABC transporter permease n=1 Tax=Falsiroseomonas selenitidurans TaxID=2716335 RepID=A0ABX1E1H3_9PROT|nr:metal ABC transporter permease [Falsiroseomonas selenitidurans]NKC29377.1 metal ABC transporter permease [Falsiroseomonas selenitidurans]
MIEALVQPWTHGFMQQALAVGLMVAALSAILSCFVVLKGWSLMGDAVSHAILPGVVGAWLLGIPLVIGAFVAGLTCALASGAIRATSRVKEDAAMGVVFSGMFAVGLILLSQVRSNVHLSHVLFGSILGIEAEDFWQTLGIASAALLILALRGRDLVLFCFDPGQARIAGLHPGRLRLLLLTVLAASIVTGVQAVGVILVVALLITPGAIGLLMADRFGRMVWVSVGAACTATLVGIQASFMLDASTAGSIVLALSAIFVAALLFSPRHGLLRPRRVTPLPAPAE